MIRDMTGAPGLTVIWPPEATPTGTSSFSEITQRLDVAQARLEAVEAHLAGLDPQTPLATDHERELHEIRWQVAELTAQVLGADHPLVRLVTPLRDDRVSHRWPHGEVAPAESPPGSWLAGGRVHCFIHRVSFRP
jgi:hypothetical protein